MTPEKSDDKGASEPASNPKYPKKAIPRRNRMNAYNITKRDLASKSDMEKIENKTLESVIKEIVEQVIVDSIMESDKTSSKKEIKATNGFENGPAIIYNDFKTSSDLEAKAANGFGPAIINDDFRTTSDYSAQAHSKEGHKIVKRSHGDPEGHSKEGHKIAKHSPGDSLQEHKDKILDKTNNFADYFHGVKAKKTSDGSAQAAIKSAMKKIKDNNNLVFIRNIRVNKHQIKSSVKKLYDPKVGKARPRRLQLVIKTFKCKNGIIF